MLQQRDNWLGVELRHLAALVAVAETGSFRGAARRLGYVQSAVSQQIAALERLVGARLVDRSRGPRPVSLTEAGEVLLDHVDGILSRLSAAQADLDSISHTSPGQLRLGFCQSIAGRLMPRILPEFGKRVPGIRVRPTEAANDVALLELVERGRLDVAFGDLPLGPGPFRHCELLSDPYVLLVPSSSPVARLDRPVRLDDFRHLRFIAPSTCRSAQPEAHLRDHGLRLRVVFRSDTTSTVQALVAAGLGAAILPRQCVDPHDPETAMLDTGSVLPPRVVGLFWHRDRRETEAVDAFCEVAVAVCANDPPDPCRTVAHLPAASRSTAGQAL